VITFDRLPNVDSEKGRIYLKHDFDDPSRTPPPLLSNMMIEFLPTVATNLMNVDYQIEA
jgi:hypothetical protein